MILASLPPPTDDLIVDPKRPGFASETFDDWLRNQQTVLASAPRRVRAVSLTNQGAAIVTTTLPLGVIPAGLYRVTYYTRIARPATTNSSVIVTLGTTDTGVVVAFGGQDLNGNTIASAKSESFLMRTDAPGFLSYAVAYVSVGAQSALFNLDVIVETL